MRMIDADELKNQIRHMPRTINPDLVQYSLVQAIIADMPTLTQPNEPLTLEQLREMDGDPVWIVDVGPHKWYGPGWAIVDRDNCLVRTVKNWNAVFFESYGERWLAYRRPPEVQS